MAYKISDGYPEKELHDKIKHIKKNFGSFSDGRADYTNAPEAPIVMCTVAYKNKILLLKRGYGLADAEGYWSTINGFIDEFKSVKEIARKEIFEETGIKLHGSDIRVGKSYRLDNPKEKRAYNVFPCLTKLSKKPQIKLDKEHTDMAWIGRPQLGNYYILDDLPHAIDSALGLA